MRAHGEPGSVPASERLSFRRMTEEDLDLIASLLGDPAVMRYYPRPKTRGECLDWIRWNLANYARDGFGLWILEDSRGAFVGECGLTWQTVDGVTDLAIGYHVVAGFQGRGLATQAALACVGFARERGTERLIAVIDPANGASQRVAEKVGMTLEKVGTHDKTGRRVEVWGMALGVSTACGTGGAVNGGFPVMRGEPAHVVTDDLVEHTGDDS